MTVYNPDGTVASVFTGIKRERNTLVLEQLALGQMPMPIIITPEEALKSVGMGCSLGLLTFIIVFPLFYVRHKMSKKGAKADKA
jgi:hypothetical protein